MYLKSVALFVAIYGRGALAALPLSCQEGDAGACATGDKCTPLNTEFEPPQTGEVWFSQCCTESETSNANPPVTTTKQYCFSYSLQGWSNNLHHNIKPACSKSGGGNLAWDFYGQCSKSGTTDPYVALPALNPDGCPGQYDPNATYEVGDTVEDNGTVYVCTGSKNFCNNEAPDLKGNGLNYWKPTNSCTGTATPTGSPTFSSTQAGCPEEIDLSSNTYEAGDSVSVSLQDGRSVVYTCKGFPRSQWCNTPLYSPLSTEKGCNGDVCWPEAWNKIGGCDGTYTPTSTPTFDPANIEGCPEEYDDSADYEEGDKVSVTPAGETYGKVYQCRNWPASGHCGQDGYSPANTDDTGCNGGPCWPDAWAYLGGCTGTISPTSTPTFDPANIEGCPEEYDDSADYEEGDKVSVTPAGETYGKVYQCRNWPASGHCGQDGYSPANTDDTGCNGGPCWPDAWAYLGGCTGTISPTSTPTFDPADVGGCPEEYEVGTEYEAEDRVSVTPAGETYGKIYQCKNWPDDGYCKNEAYSPANIADKGCNGEPCWPKAWTYVGGCTGTIAPTGSPTFNKIPEWDLGGCPDEYVPNYPYLPEDVVSVAKNDDNTYGVVWKCKNEMSAPWCQQESYAPGTQHASEAWEMVGHCSGTIAPTAAPTPYLGQCQFKYDLETTTKGEYVVLQAASWVKGGTTISTVTGGTALDLYQTGHLVRYGNDARKCASYPNSGFCEQFSPFVDDVTYNPTNSPKGWKEASCEDIVSKTDGGGTEGADTFVAANNGPVFASNGNVLVTGNACQTGDDPAVASGATNPEDYFKASPAVAGCQQCPSTDGFGSPAAPKVCTTCEVGTTSAIVDGKSQCVCDNGATDPWDSNTADDPIKDHCQSCANGGKYLGNVDNASGAGVCESACPSDKTIYTERTSTGGVTYKLCCTDSGCTTGAGDCYDGTDGSICTAAFT
ncbi:hypothetical protein ACHAWT_001918 [Skeletonema menzelii]